MMAAETEADGEGFVTRWSRRKTEAGQALDDPGADTGQVSSGEPDAGDDETPRAPTDADMPPIESLTPDSDYAGFLSPEISETLRRQALRRLFHSSAVAGPDGLDDYDGDYRTFEPLGDQVTTGTRHHRYTERPSDHTEQAGDTVSVPVTGTQEKVARGAAVQAMGSSEFTAALMVEYDSRGRLLIVAPFRTFGDEMRALELAAGLRDRLTCCLVLSGMAAGAIGEFEEQAAAAGIPVLSGAEVSLSGHMGRFTATLHDGDAATDVAERAGGLTVFDLVLDLSDPPLVRAGMPPPGYFAPKNDPAALDWALRELPVLTGKFQKPVYVRYDPDICAHTRDGIPGCRRCLDACPSDAIRSVDGRIEVDTHLCQGGGSCTTACPTGALRYTYPPVETLLATIRAALARYREAGGVRPVLLFHDGGPGKAILTASQDGPGEGVIPVEVEDIGSVGLEIALEAMAYGAAALGVLLPPQTPASVVRELEVQTDLAHALLDGLDLGPGRIQLLRADPTRSLSQLLEPLAAWPALEWATHAVFDDKRTNLRLAIDHLCAQAPSAATVIPLPSLAPFGDVIVDREACTLCMACPSLCPTGALLAGGEIPRLGFIENRCVQCGLCRAGCPEAAIELVARLTVDPEARHRQRTLAEDRPFRCVRCGKAFGTRRMIERMTAKLADHPMFQDAAVLHRLKLCENCRVVAIFETGHGTGT